MSANQIKSIFNHFDPLIVEIIYIYKKMHSRLKDAYKQNNALAGDDQQFGIQKTTTGL